tara:strand:- start:996 stop:1523 length:528 start_codon:yes stop_codon:yes gene_type:complete
VKDSKLNRMTGPVALLALAGLALVGCQSGRSDLSTIEWNDDARRDTNAWLINTYQGQQVENAITRQHTIWSHHFVQGTTALTPRAERDLGVLRDHYIKHGGGVLTVRQGEADDALFADRLRTVRGWLAQEGVPMASLDIQHDLYTGAGKRSTRAAEDYVRPSSDEPYDIHRSVGK